MNTDDLLDMIHILTNKTIRKSMEDAGMRIDWKAVTSAFDSWRESIPLIVPKPEVEPFKGTIFEPAPPTLTVKEDIAAVRAMNPGLSDWQRLCDILDRLDQKSYFTYTMPPNCPFPYVPPQSPVISPPIWPSYTPYVGDPPFPGSSTICRTVGANEKTPMTDKDIPF